MTPESFQGQTKAFNNADVADTEALWRVDYLKRVNEVPAIKRYKQKALELLGPQKGEHILDIGCGIGEGLRAIYDHTPTVKSLVGIDNSQTMIAQAFALTPQDLLNGRTIMFQQEDAHNLSFENERFDASYSDRTFQHLTQPHQAFREMVRVTKSGGRIIVADTDWSTLGFRGTSPKVEKTIRDTYFNIITNPHMGGMLEQIFKENGLKDIEVLREAIDLPSLQAIEDVLALEKSLNLAKDNGLFSKTDSERCLEELLKPQGVVEASLAIFIVKGVK